APLERGHLRARHSVGYGTERRDRGSVRLSDGEPPGDAAEASAAAGGARAWILARAPGRDACSRAIRREGGGSGQGEGGDGEEQEQVGGDVQVEVHPGVDDQAGAGDGRADGERER